MANRTPTLAKTPDGWLTVTWEGFAGDGDDVGLPVSLGAIKNGFCAQATGTWGDDGQVAIQGSNDGTNFSTLTDVAGNSAAFTSNGLAQIAVVPKFVRVLQVEGEAAVTDVDVTITAQYFR